jgi:hypothetical protein
LERPDFTEALVADLRPVRPAMPWSHAIFIWSAASAAMVSVAILARAPLREGLAGDLLESPRFALELILGMIAAVAAIWAGLELGVPGAPRALRLWTPPLLLFSGWTLAIGYGFTSPSLEPTMLGKREHCFIEATLLALPSFALALHLLRERVAFAHSRTGLLAGAAAAAIPAVWMQAACMYEPMHALKFHLSPILIVGAFGALVAQRVLSRT